jgi:hypothetical protein
LLDVAAYHALVPGRGPAVAALLIAAVNGVAALVLVAVAQKIGASDTEEKLAVQMRDLAAAEINKDVEQVRNELAEISNSVHKVRTGLSAVSTVSFEVVTLLLGNLLRSRKRRS